MFEILDKLTPIEALYTPFKFNIHLIFCIIATIVYILQYKLKGNKNSLLYMIGIDLTFITQINAEPVTITTLAICEVFILLVAFIRWIVYKTKKTDAIQSTENVQQAIVAETEDNNGDKE